MKSRLDDPTSYSDMNPYTSGTSVGPLHQPKCLGRDAWDHTDLFDIGIGDGGSLGRLLADIARCPAARRLQKIENLTTQDH